MNFFKKHPRFWIVVWSLFGLGGLGLAYNSVFDNGFDAYLLIKGFLGFALAGMMISYLLPEVRNSNAPNQ